MIKFNRFAICALVFASFSSAHGKLVQILHTNDTHSFISEGTHGNGGGSARLKSLIEFYKEKAADEGVANLTFDAGDFLEGNTYYMAEKGRASFNVHNQMGYDMVTLGNHDYLMGPRELDKMLGEIDLKFSFLAANLEISSEFPNIRKKIKPFKEIEIAGVKVAILGLTTNEVFYAWSFKSNKITDPFKSAEKYEKILKERKNDFVIALTHIGLSKDKQLAEKTKNIDLIVGGHSHTIMTKAEYVKNKNKKMVPIVQAGLHTEYLGRLIVDLEKGKPLKVVSYELIPVKYESEDVQIKNLVEEADTSLNNLYGENWLNEKIGYSDLKKDDPSGSRKWAYFITDSLKDKAKTDVAIHVPPMNGENYPVGSITRKSIMDSFPRIFEVTQVNGWAIYTAKVKGIWLKTIFETLANFGQPLTFSGISVEYVKSPFGYKVKRTRINGKAINPFKNYTVAFTEGVIRGALAVSPKTKILLQEPAKTKHMIWQTLQERVMSEKLKLRAIKETDRERTFFYPEAE
jgi:2',3'-cyclic-nucleotide 2'-phosphodiesterase (5'-nucleotidase family)